ncbi:MAG: hypothetical protein AAF357_12725, partial [Verrucomicrobiota bacterium]
PDFRGNRINLFKLTDNGSAYTSSQVEDLVSSKHRAFRPIDIKMGPDGAIYVADWYNPIIQHGEVDFRDPRRDKEHGRIWRISFDGRELLERPEIASAPDSDLVSLALESNAGWVREQAGKELRTRDAESVLAVLESSSPSKEVDSDLFELRKIWAAQSINHLDIAAIETLLGSKNHKARAGALRALYYTASEHEEAFTLASKAVSDSHPQVRLWAVSVLAQLDSPDTLKLALRALEGVEVDDFLDFAIWSICREHEDRWTHLTESGNPFENTSQLLFAARALNKAVAVPILLSSLEKGEFTTDQQIADFTDWISKVGSPADLNSIFGFGLAEATSESAQSIVLEALASAGRIRKIQPAGDTNRLSRFLRSSNPALFASAAALAGQWKLESARGGLEEAFLAAPTDKARAEAALAGLISLGGPKTASLFQQLAKDAAAPFLTRSLAVIGRTRMNPAEGAKLAVALLNDAPEGKDPHGIFDAFLSNKQGPPALAAALKNASLPQEIALIGMQKASSAATSPAILVKAIQEAGGLKPMKMALTPDEMEAMMEQVASSGNPYNGEAIYRRAALQCIVCHAIGGAGGIIGPDMVSIGASAPVDYLIDSLLQPSVKIKEGYHTTLVTLKNGDSFAGAIAREDENEIVIRDAVGSENRIAKSDVATNQISPVSLMPPGLTASLREDEFVDLVRFLSELGKDGDFKTPPNRFVRQWQALMPHERTRDAIGHQGKIIFTEEIETYLWLPIYSKVNGALPVNETPDVVGRGKNRYAVARTFIDAPEAGEVQLLFQGALKDLVLFHGEDQVSLPENGSEAKITLKIEKPGRQKFTLVGLKNFGLNEVSLELLDDAGKTQLVPVLEF